MTALETRPRGRRVQRRPQRRRLLPAGAAVLALAVLLAAAGLLLRDRGLPGEGVALPDYVEEDLLPVNDWSRPGTPLEKIDGVVIHYVGNPDTTAEANRNYFASLSTGELDTYASSHFIVGLEGEVIQCIPLTEIAYATPGRNEDTIAIEVCHPDETGEFSAITYDRVVELTAWLCREFRLDPAKDVIRHYDATEKLCPLYYVEHPEAWDQFRSDVADEMAAQAEAETPS